MEKVLYKRKGRIAFTILNEPDRKNPVDREFIAEMKKCCIMFREDTEARVLIIRPKGEHFSIGADLLNGVPSIDFSKLALSMLPSNFEIWKPVIAAIKGYCVGGGWMIAQDCDLRIASYDAKLGIPEVKWNFIPPFCAGLTQQHLSPSISLESILTANVISGSRAYEIGFVNRVVTKENVMDAAIELAEELCLKEENDTMTRKKYFYYGLNKSFQIS